MRGTSPASAFSRKKSESAAFALPVAAAGAGAGLAPADALRGVPHREAGASKGARGGNEVGLGAAERWAAGVEARGGTGGGRTGIDWEEESEA